MSWVVCLHWQSAKNELQWRTFSWLASVLWVSFSDLKCLLGHRKGNWPTLIDKNTNTKPIYNTPISPCKKTESEARQVTITGYTAYTVEKSSRLHRLSSFFSSQSTQNRYFKDFPKRISWLGMEKLNLTQQKHAFTNQKKCTTTQNKQTNLKPGLVASYNIQPGNGEGLFWCWHFIGCHLLTHLDTHLLTPQTHTGPF